VAHGVKCHVTWHVMEMQRAIVFAKQENNLCRLQAEVCDLHSLAFLVVSGPVVAPTGVMRDPLTLKEQT
jgi:hypothetical protein